MTARLTCHGGVGNVTGANFLFEYNETRVLVDCGLLQGAPDAPERNREAFAYDPSSIDVLFLTHAHMDHIGRVPKLVSDGFRGRIISTPETREIAAVMFEDSLAIMEYERTEEGEPPLYEKEDVETALSLWETRPYYEDHRLTDDITVTFSNAGHILGSALVTFTTASGGHVVFTGDLGNNATRILPPTDEVTEADYLVMDSVYGDRLHESADERREKFRSIVAATIERGGAVMIPAFSLERTQDILFLLNDLIEGGGLPSVPVYLDSPLAIRITDIYRRLSDHLSEEARAYLADGDAIFDFPRLEFTADREDSIAINSAPNPKIVIAGSGMSTGGRVLHHEKRYLPDENSTLLLVGYQAVGTLGRELEEGAETVVIDGDEIPVNARVERIEGFSSHKDADGLLDFVAPMAETLKRVFVAMGEPRSSMHLAQQIRHYLGVDAIYPEEGKVYELDL